MKTIWGILIIITIAFAGRKGFGLWQKVRHANRLKTTIQSFQLPKDFHLKHLVKDIQTTLTIAIQNFSSSTFSVEQLDVQLENLQGQLVAKQSRPLSNPIALQPNQTTPLTLLFDLTPQQVGVLIGQVGGLAKVAANWLSTGKYGIQLQVKGFVQVDGVSVTLNERVSI